MIRSNHVLSHISFKSLFVAIACSLISLQATASNHSNALEGFDDEPQLVTVSGIVTSELGDPLPGVNVVVKGTATGTATNTDGEYKLEVESLQDTLVFSFIGYQTQEVPINGRTQVNVTLQPQAISGEELVVVGYGTQRKSDLTGSVSSVNPEDLQKGSINTIDKQLGGQVAGVQVTSASGQPGSGTSIRIRGTSSILGNSEPLFVLDGIPVGTSSGSLGPNILQEINPENIESIEVLKDASATAIYGSRGANGVVLISTKTGQSGDTRVDFNSYYGIQELSKKIDVLNAEELAQVHQMAIDNGTVDPLYDPDEVSGAGVDWQDELYRTAPTQKYNMSVSGGNENNTYMFSGSYMDQGGIVRNSGFQRTTLSGNVNSKAFDEKLSLTGSLMASLSESDIPRTSGGSRITAIGGALIANPQLSVRDPSGNFTIFSDYQNLNANPIGTAELITNESNRNRIIGDLSAAYNISEDLELNVKFGANISNSKDNFFAPLNTREGSRDGRAGSVSHANSISWVSTNLLTYNKEINENHNLKIMGGFTAEKDRTEFVSARASLFSTDIQGYHSLETGENQLTNSNLFESQLVSFISRANYNLMDKYLLTLTGRYDGSSKFKGDNKWSLFPSGALGWRLSEEPFMQNADFINHLKLRVSAGISGEQGIGSYQTLPALSSISSALANDTRVVGFIPSRMANNSLRWEETRQLNAGLELELWESRVNFTADFYYKKTTDLLFRKSIPPSSGFSSRLQNVGDIENKGMEYSLETRNITTSNFNWSTNFNISFNRNKILDLGTFPDGTEIERITSPPGGISIGSLGLNPSILKQGEPVGVFYGWIFDGTYKSEQEITNGPEPNKNPGDAKFRDIDGDGDVDGEDRTIIGDPNPDFFGGMRNTFQYKGWQLSTHLQWRYGHEIFNINHLALSKSNGNRNAGPWNLNAWTEENSDSNIPRAGWDFRAKGANSWHVEDGSFLRLRNITLEYSFSREFLGQNIRKLRAYVSADNLFTITGYSGYNPDVSAFGSNNIAPGFDRGVYPLAKVYTAGIEIGI